MNTVLTEEELELQKIYKEYADERIRPHTLEIDKGLFSVEPLLKEMHELGFCSIVIPKEYGGLGSSYVHYVLAVEELSKASGPVAKSVSGQTNMCFPILHYGTEVFEGLKAYRRPDGGVQLFQPLGKLFPLVGIGIAQSLRVEQAPDLPAVLHNVQRFEQVSRAVAEGWVHDDGGVLLAGAERKKIVMHHPETVLFELGPEIAGKLDAVKIDLFQLVEIFPADLPCFGVVVNAAHGVDLAGKRSITGRRFKNGGGKALETTHGGF